MNSAKKNAVKSINNSKNKLNNEIILIFHSYPNARKVCVWQKLKSQLILLFSLFLLLFMGPTVLFGTIHEYYCTISVNFYFYL